MSSLILALTLLAAGDSTVTFGPPRATADSFELPMQAQPRLLKKLERHLVGHRLVVFIPGATGTAQSKTIEAGPVASLRVTPAQLGLAVTLHLRGGTDGALDRLSVRQDADPALRYVETLAPPAAAEAPRPAASEVPTAAATAPRPSTETAPARPSGPLDAVFAQARAQPEKVVLASAAGGESGTRGTALALLLVVLVGAAGAATFLQRRRAREKTVGETIDVVAVRSFGAKQKLVLVNTCGDRLLLATCDKEVRLLKNLGPASATDTSFAAALASVEEGQNTSAADVAGLLKLRARRPDETRPDGGVAA
jgi:flagellar biogenesis protein FliO